MCVSTFCFDKKMKKSVVPLSLKEPVQGGVKCILPGFLSFFGNLMWRVTENFFDFFSEYLLHYSEFAQLT